MCVMLAKRIPYFISYRGSCQNRSEEHCKSQKHLIHEKESKNNQRSSQESGYSHHCKSEYLLSKTLLLKTIYLYALLLFLIFRNFSSEGFCMILSIYLHKVFTQTWIFSESLFTVWIIKHEVKPGSSSNYEYKKP